MEILGIGLPEMAFILLIALILLGPKDMIEAGKTIGRTMRKIIMSDTWQTMRKTGQEIQRLPTTLMREAGLDDIEKELKNIDKQATIKPPSVRQTLNESIVFNNSPEPPSKPAEQKQTEVPPEPETKKDGDA